MSEYQYYEWQAIDRSLSPDEVEEVEGLSSHMEVVTSTQAIVTYQWGDFKHDPQKVLLQYFDAALYYANWGSRRLMFRFPKAAIDPQQIEDYCLVNTITLTENGEYAVLDIDMQEEGADWVEHTETLGQFVPLWEQIMQGDYRVLYLAWLKGIALDESDEAPEDQEPPVPAGMQELSASLKAFANFFDIDRSLVQAAAAKSSKLKPVKDELLAGALSRLSREECESYLLRVLKNERQVGSALRKRLAELAGVENPAATASRRTAESLFEEAKRLEQVAREQEKVEAERKRIQELEDFAKSEELTWPWVIRLIEQKQAKPYDEAVALLVKLRDLAVYQKRLPEFTKRVDDIVRRYVGRPSLMERLRTAKLVE